MNEYRLWRENDGEGFYYDWGLVVDIDFAENRISLCEMASECEALWDDDIDLDEVEFEQFTGVLDKNSQKIYENDIIKFVVNNVEHFRQVVYQKEYGCFMLVKRGNTSYSFLEMYQTGVSELEVVGNIHENPELLEDK